MKIFPGIVFRDVGGDRYRLEISRRADLAAGRVERGTQRGSVVHVDGMQLARRLVHTLDRKFGTAGTFSDSEMTTAVEACRRNGLRVALCGQAPKTRKATTDRRGVVKRVVEDPLVDGEQLEHLLEMHKQHPSRRQPGFTSVDVSMEVLIGGAARLKGLSKGQVEGAREFRSTAEEAQLGGARAIDYSRPTVDTSGPSIGMVEDTGADARASYARARAALGAGSLRLKVAETMIVDGANISECAERVGLGSGGQARKIVGREIRAATEVLARHFGHVARHTRKPRNEMIGDRPPLSTASS
jgi:hypothetical protein